MLSKKIIEKSNGWSEKIGQLQERIVVAKAAKQRADIDVRGHVRDGNVDSIIEAKKLQQKLSAELADLQTIEDALKKQCPIDAEFFKSELSEFNKKQKAILEKKQGSLSKALMDLQEVFKSYDAAHIEYQKAYSPWKALAKKLLVHSKEILDSRSGYFYRILRYNTDAALAWEKKQNKEMK